MSKYEKLQLKFVDWGTITCNAGSAWKRYASEDDCQPNTFHTDIDEGYVSLTVHYSFVESRDKQKCGSEYIHILMVYEDSGKELICAETRVKKQKQTVGIEYVEHLMDEALEKLQREIEVRLGFEI
jgi:hypothetical protein